MEQKTAQNNSPQFSYPDLSGGNQNQPTSQAQQTQQPNQQVQGQQQVNQTADDAKMEELKKGLENLKTQAQKEDSSAPSTTAKPDSTPAPTPTPTTPQPSGETQPKSKPQPQQQHPVQQQKTPPPSQASVPEKEADSYVQEPKPLPAMDKKIPSDQVASQPSEVSPPSGEGFAPLPSDLPQLNQSLDNIMPDGTKKVQSQETLANEDTKEPVVSDQNPQVQPQVKEDESIESMQNPENITAEKLMSEAINRGASDLHISVGYPPILRIDGELINLGETLLGPEDTERLVFSVLTDEKKELLEVNREVDLAYTHKGAVNSRFRINAFYTMKNLSAAFRLIPSRIKTIEELKLPQIYNQFAKLKQGLILVTGPTGHGKSTTIAAILEAINRTRFCHIVTIEDPIEYVFEGKKALIDQREMNDDTHSWNIALRSALRQDPDVILVGEMRDFETIAAAITLAETGHLVFATLHTNSAAQTINRIIDVFPESQQQQVRTQVANTLQAVIAQRLIPLDNGGRRAVSEIMLNTSAIKNLIREGKAHQIDNVIRTSADLGMVYLERSLVNLVREGVISVQAAQEYAVHPEEVLRLLKE